MSSQRLPGKVLRVIRSRAILDYVVEIVRRGGVDETVVATSDDPTDEPIVQFCKQHDVPVVCGSLEDVASRFSAVLRNSDWDAFVRVSADSPLLDVQLVSWANEAIRREGCDLATNIHPRSFPRGQSIEAIRRATFLESLPKMTQPGDTEHVTPVFYRRASELSVINLHCDVDYGGRHLAIDTPEDFERVALALEHLEGEPWRFSLAEIVAAFDQAESPQAEAA